MYYVYMVQCRDNTIYTGVAIDVVKRVEQHNQGRGSKYVRTRLPCKLVWQLKVGEMGEALREERRIKKLSHSAKLALIRCDSRRTHAES